MKNPLSRRDYLKTASAVGITASVAGCMNNAPNLPQVESLPRPYLGATEEEAVVTVQIFEDYGCPHCQRWSAIVFPQLEERYADSTTVRLEWWDLPLPVTSLSRPAAYAVRSVQNNVSMDAFWEANKEVMAGMAEDNFRRDNLLDIAEETGMDRQTADDEVRANVYKPVIDSDSAHAQEIGVPGTPGIYVNQQLISNPSPQNIINAIESYQ